MSEELKGLAEAYSALATAQSKFTAVKMNQSAIVRGNKEYKYGDLQAIIEATRSALNECGIFATFVIETEYGEGRPAVSATPMLFHKNGTVIKGNTVKIVAGDGSPHSVGSAMTYAKRYALASMLCVAAEEDDDGHTAMEGQQGNNKRAAPQTQPQRPQNQSPPPASGRQSSKPATAPRNQSSANGRLEQWVDGKLNPKYQTANGLLSIKELKEFTDAMEKAEINGEDMAAYLNKTIYKDTPIKTRYDIRKEDFSAIMLLIEKNPKLIFTSAISDKEDDTPPWEGDQGFITTDQVDHIKKAVSAMKIPVDTFRGWLAKYTFALGAKTDSPERIWPLWYDEIVRIIRDEPEVIMSHGK